MGFGANGVLIWKWPLLSVHVLLWIALAIKAYNNAGPYHFASCWPVILLYLPPASILFFLIGATSLIIVLASFSRPAMRRHPGFWVAIHGMLLTIGLVACNFSAYAAVGPVNCL
jgi:hypothetical protein